MTTMPRSEEEYDTRMRELATQYALAQPGAGVHLSIWRQMVALEQRFREDATRTFYSDTNNYITQAEETIELLGLR